MKSSKETLKMRSKTAFATAKNETIALMLERKLKISAKFYENVVKTPKETLKTRLKTRLATKKKNKTIALMLERKLRISAM